MASQHQTSADLISQTHLDQTLNLTSGVDRRFSGVGLRRRRRTSVPLLVDQENPLRLESCLRDEDGVRHALLMKVVHPGSKETVSNFEEFDTGEMKISRAQFIRYIKSIAGDKLLAAILRSRNQRNIEDEPRRLVHHGNRGKYVRRAATSNRMAMSCKDLDDSGRRILLSS
ncbi:hypothetical protein AKJ16_DCAP06687 [Drosera capensis]